MTYALGIVGYVAVRALLSGFTARHDFRTPFRFGIAAIAVNLVSSAVLAWIAAPLGWGHAALGLGTSLASLVNCGLLLWALIQTGVYRPLPGWSAMMLRVIAACIAMGTLLWALDPDAAVWRDWQLTQRLTRLGLLVGAGALVYGGSLWVLGLRPTHLRIRQATSPIAPHASRP
jgi:putative peptidoglycan lipid II flippase